MQGEAVSDSNSSGGFIIDIKRATREPFVACLVITPKSVDGSADLGAKVERNLGRGKAVQIAHELLAACGASDQLLAEVHALAPQLKGPLRA